MRSTLLFALGLALAACGSPRVASPATSSGEAEAVEQPTSRSSTTEGASSEPTTATAEVTTTAVPTTAVPPTDPPTPDGAPLPRSAAELAAELNRAEAAVRDPTVSDRASWGRRQQAMYRLLAVNDQWVDEVMAAIEDLHIDAVQANWEARRELSSLVLSADLATELPAWDINPPLPPEELLGYYDEAAAESGVPWSILAAINLVETRMGRIEGVSTAGAVGPMQFLPTTWAECCEGDPTNPRDAIRGAARYLNQRGAQDSIDRALRGYNNSDYYVKAVRAYAGVLDANREAYWGYHAWQVYFRSADGLLILPEGYYQAEPIPVADYLATNPDALVPGS